MRKPQISIVIPTYDSALYLPQALDSIFNQNVTNYEVIVIDDGSTDDTQQVLRPYMAQIQYLSQSNAGSAAARNRGLDQAQGEFVVFLDADDMMLPGKLRQQAAYLQLRPSLGYVHSGWRLIDAKGNVLHDVEPWYWAPHLTLEEWLQYKPVQMGAMMFRRLWLDSVGGLDPALRQSHDVDLMLRLSLDGCQGAWLYKPTICYRQHATSTIRKNATRQAESVLAVLDKFFAMPQVPQPVREQKSKTYYYSTMWLAWHLYSNGFIEETVPYLRQSMTLGSQVTAVSPTVTILDWFFHFVRWDEQENPSQTDLSVMVPRFEQAADELTAWDEIDRLLRWWLAERPFTPPQRLDQLATLWSVYQMAMLRESQSESLTAERMLQWWYGVWHAYLQADYEQANAALKRFPGLTVTEFIRLTQFAVACQPDKVTTALISGLWQDVQKLALFETGDYDELALFQDLPRLRRPKVSVIIPAYNCARYIGETIDSVKAQTYTDYELIVVNDGSDDDTADVLRPYHPHIRYVYQQNQGVSAARNHGLHLAQGEFILFLDADDTLLANKLAEQVACLEANPDLGGVHSGWRLVDQYGRPIQDMTPWQQTPDLTLADWLQWKPVFLGAMLFRRQWLTRIDGFDPQLPQAEDTDLLFRLAWSGCRMTWLKKSTVCYRQHDTSIMSNGKQQAESLSHVLDKFFNLPDLPPSIRELESKVRRYTLIWIVWQLYRTGYMEEVPFYLRQAQAYIPPDHSPMLMAQKWLVQLINYARNEGVEVAQLQVLLAHFGPALALPPDETTCLEKRLTGWLVEWPNLKRLAAEQEIWPLVQGALHLEKEGHVFSAIRWLAWWLNVWQYYAHRGSNHAGENLPQFQDLSLTQLVQMAKASILWQPYKIDLSQITMFWRAARDHGVIRPSDHHAVTSLYLTFMGQAVMGKNWPSAWAGLVQALRMGIHPQAVRAWQQFVYMAFRYIRNGRR